MADDGMSATLIATRLGVPRRTVAGWLAGSRRPRRRAGCCEVCGTAHDVSRLGASYLYLLGLYLGDGCISRHARDVFRLRIFLDEKYPGIVERAVHSATEVAGHRANTLKRPCHCVEVYSYWKAWPCLLPQHGSGKKHERTITLADWQERLIQRIPRDLLTGLIHSDGCRFQNTGRGGWSAPRYAFKNRSVDIHVIFRHTCELVGVNWSAAGADTTYVSRQRDVELLDGFIGPKA